MAALLSLHPWQELLEVVEFGVVWDGQPASQVHVLQEDERIGFLVGLAVHEPFGIDAALQTIWGEPRLVVPTLGPEPLSVMRSPSSCSTRTPSWRSRCSSSRSRRAT